MNSLKLFARYSREGGSPWGADSGLQSVRVCHTISLHDLHSLGLSQTEADVSAPLLMSVENLHTSVGDLVAVQVFHFVFSTKTGVKRCPSKGRLMQNYAQCLTKRN